MRSPGPRERAGGGRIPDIPTGTPGTEYRKVRVIMPSDDEGFNDSRNVSRQDKQTSGTFIGWIKRGLSVLALSEEDLTGDSVQAHCDKVRAEKERK